MTTYIGTDGNDTLTGLDDVSDDLTGGLGNDVLIGGGGGKGFDWAHYDSAPSAVTVNLSTGTASGGDGNDTLNGIEGVTGSAYNDTLTGISNSYSVLWGGKGDDLLIGGDSGADLKGGSGNDILQGGKGFDSVYYDDASSSVTVNLSNGTATGGSGSDTLSSIEEVYGSAYNDTLTGSNDSNSCLLWGGNGDDLLICGDSDTDLRGGSGNDILQGGKGFDWAYYDDASSSVTVNLSNGTATGGSGSDTLINIEDVYGSAYNDTLTGNDLDNYLEGQAGNDVLAGGKGNDTLYGDNGKDVLQGGAGNDWLDGGSANDALLGGSGNDTLSGGDGKDKLTGGAGIDNFLFNTNLIGSVDTIADFTVADDTIQLDNYIFTSLKAEGTLTAGKFVIGTHALDANDFIIYNNVTGALLYDADGSGGGAAVPIAMIGTGLAMTHSDFVVI